MQNASSGFKTSLAGLDWADWLTQMKGMIGDLGFVEELGPDHAAAFRSNGATLLVTFESHDRITQTTRTAHPLGWEMVDALGWSHLSVMSAQESWFRAPRVFGFFDGKIDDGFFEEFDQVIFYGAGACGYAAAAYSVAAPGARVLAIQPQATLDPRITEWDDRFTSQRRTDFETRFGYAPDMLDAADRAYVLYDPEIEMDAMHAALFTRPNVTKFRMRFLGPRMEDHLRGMNILLRMLAQLSADKLTRVSLAKLYRKRRDYGGYQFSLLKKITRDERNLLTTYLTRHVLAQRDAPPFRKAQARALSALAAQSRSNKAATD